MSVSPTVAPHKETDEAASRLLGAFEAARNMAVAINDDARIVTCNHAFAAQFGQAPRRLRGLDLAEISAEPEYFKNWWRAFKELKTESGYLPLPDGRNESVRVPFNASPDVLPGLHLLLSFFPEELVRRSPDREELTPRERSVLTLIARGEQNPEIAKELGIAVESVKTHADNLREKLNARTRAEAVALGLMHGEIALPLTRERQFALQLRR